MKAESDGRKRWPSGQRVGMVRGAVMGAPSTKTRWQPMPRVGFWRARAAAASNAGPAAMRVAEVRQPAW